MNPEQFKLWISRIPLLTKEQVSAVLIRFKLLDNSLPKEHAGRGDFSMRLLQCVCDVMRKNNVETPSMHTLKKSAAFSQSKEKIQDLSDYFEGISKSKIVQDSILKIGLNLLYHDLLYWQLAISSHTILKQCHRIPSVLSRHFPGYAASGLLTKLVKGA